MTSVARKTASGAYGGSGAYGSGIGKTGVEAQKAGPGPEAMLYSHMLQVELSTNSVLTQY